MNDERIGKIQAARFGHGGYQDAMIGVSWTLGSDKESWGVGDFWGACAIKRSDGAKWSEGDRIVQLGEAVMRLNKVLQDAKRQTIDQLVGVPVEVTFEGMVLKSWRVLTEAI